MPSLRDNSPPLSMDALQEPGQSNEQDLWRCVLLQAYKDLEGPNNIPSPVDRRKVLFWLTTPDFAECCNLAGLDPEAAFLTFQTLAKETEDA
jgi:hypothetical protein